MPKKTNYFNDHIFSNDLTEREIQVLFLIANGKTNAGVGTILYLSPDTIKASVGLIIKKLKAENRAQAVYIATRKGIFAKNISLFDDFVNKL